MKELPGEISDRLETGLTRLFTLSDETERVRGVHALLESCGYASFSELHAEVDDREKSERLLKLDRDLLAGLMSEPWFVFMNHGYAPTGDEVKQGYFPAELCPEKDSWLHQINLYFKLLGYYIQRYPPFGDWPMFYNTSVLDIGCGRGGGLRYLALGSGPFKKMVGIDANPGQIAFCADRYQSIDNLEFVQGSAMAIPLGSESIDIITNVESSHCYEDLPKFFAEARRVLRPGGMLLLADNRERYSGKIFTLETAMLASGLKPVRKENITEGVLRACVLDAERFGHLFDSKRADIVRKISWNSAKAYSSGAGVYLAYALEKPDSK
jgi:ubiquinone/menaquinone biosynthesis C-methylase UbiE